VITPNKPEAYQRVCEPHQTCCEALGKHRRPVDEPPTLEGRWEQRIAAQEQSAHDLCMALLRRGADRDDVLPLFAGLQDLLAETRASSARTRRELREAEAYRDALHRRVLELTANAPEAVPPVPAAGADYPCPDPRGVKTPPEFMEKVRTFRTWTGDSSYRVMSKRINGRFGASTLHNALNSDKLPRLEMVRSIIEACGGTTDHQDLYVSAWRLIALAQKSAPEAAPAKPSLYAVSKSA
jgi:hypothetical protein